MGIVIDLKGQKFASLLVVEYLGTNSDNKALWRCLCDCGKEATVTGKVLRSGRIKSCGCARQRVRKGNLVIVGEPLTLSDRKLSDCSTHGMGKTRTYNSWQRIRQFCYNPNCKKYPKYGGRGIKVCDRWLESFQNFLEDMGERPEGMTLDRKDNDKDYTPENCRWATPKQQSNNRNYCKKFEYKGELLTIAELADRFNWSYSTLYQRICTMKWDVEKALTTPKQVNRKANSAT